MILIVLDIIAYYVFIVFQMQLRHKQHWVWIGFRIKMHSVISHPQALYKGWNLIFYIILWCSLDEDTWINDSHHGPSPLLRGS